MSPWGACVPRDSETDLDERHSGRGRDIVIELHFHITNKTLFKAFLSYYNHEDIAFEVPDVAVFHEGGRRTVTVENSPAPSMSRNAADVDVISS